MSLIYLSLLFFIKSFGRYLSALLLACAMTAVAQAQVSDELVEEVLAEAEAKSGFIDVFSRSSKLPLLRIDAGTSFTKLGSEGRYQIVRFTQPAVPAWASARYLDVANGIATVKANNLNLRLRPSRDARVLTRLRAGYRSQVLGARDGFVQIYAPTSLEFAIRNNNRSGWVAGKRVRASNAKAPATQTNRLSPETERTPPSTKKPVINDSPVIQTTADTTSSVAQQSTTQVSSSQYLLAPGDSVSLRVFGESDLSLDNVRIPGNGAISLPLIGAIQVAGKTTAQVERDIAERLSQGYVRNPQVSLTIFSYRPIFIRGAISSVGAYPFSEGLNVANAIALAGGVKNSAKRDSVSILRNGQTVAENLSAESNLTVQPGDVISIQEELGVSEEGGLYVYLHGEVASPGEYRFRRGLTVEKAVVLAGGFTIRAARNKVSVTRYLGKEANEEPEKLKRVKLYMPVEPGDIIDVGASWF